MCAWGETPETLQSLAAGSAVTLPCEVWPGVLPPFAEADENLVVDGKCDSILPEACAQLLFDECKKLCNKDGLQAKTLRRFWNLKLFNLDLSHCAASDEELIELIQRQCSSARLLCVYECKLTAKFGTLFLQRKLNLPALKELNLGSCAKALKNAKQVLSYMPNLQMLILHGSSWEELFDEESPLNSDKTGDFIQEVLSYAPDTLKHLDLSYWPSIPKRLPKNLIRLYVHDVSNLWEFIDCLCELNQLRSADLSVSDSDHGEWPKPGESLRRLVLSWRDLEVLDISYTNLAAQQPLPVTMETDEGGPVDSDIYGLCWLRRPLKYLGIWECDGAAGRARLPAVKVAGEHTEAQIFCALEAMSNRPALLTQVLNETFTRWRADECEDATRAMDLIIEAMRVNISSASVQLASTATLFYLLRGVGMLNWHHKQRVFDTFLEALEWHGAERSLARNCCLALCQFRLPQELSLYLLPRCARLLLDQLHSGDSTTERVAIHLLNALACHPLSEPKLMLAKCNAIKVVLQRIRTFLDAKECNEVLETCWSFLWNVTDETDHNCQQWIENDGLDLLCSCFESFSTEWRLLRNCMGLLGNVAEVAALRPFLLKESCLSLCQKLLSAPDQLEVAYNACGVLAHMVSDTYIQWDVDRRLTILDAMEGAVLKWKLDAERFINYRSLKPIIDLLNSCFNAARLWAAWACANLTTTDLNKYCQLIEAGNAEQMLERLVSESSEQQNGSESCQKKIKELAQQALGNLRSWQQQGRPAPNQQS